MRIMALIQRICIQMIRDKRTLALLFLAPLLVLTLMYTLFNSDSVSPKLGVKNIDASLVEVLEKTDISVKEYNQITTDSMLEDDLDGFLSFENNNYQLTLQNDEPTAAKGLQMKVNQAIDLYTQLKQNVSVSLENPILKTRYLFGSDESVLFDVISPVLIAFFVFFFVFLISGIGLLRERITGTLERLMSTPIRRGEIIAGYLIGYGIFAILQTLIVVVYSINVLEITLVGSIWNVLLVNLVVAFVALSLGILLSTFATSEFQMIQFIPLVVIPQVFFAGIFPLDGVANWLVSIGKVMPLYYAADALKGVMYKGYSINEISGDIFALSIFAVIFIILNIFALKKYRTL